MSIEKIVFALADKFTEVDWDLEYEENLEMYCILLNNWQLYDSKELKNWRKILSKKFNKVRFFIAYKNFKH